MINRLKALKPRRVALLFASLFGTAFAVYLVVRRP